MTKTKNTAPPNDLIDWGKAILIGISMGIISLGLEYYINNQEFKIKQISTSILVIIIITVFAYIVQKINSLIYLLNSEENIIKKIEKYVDNRILSFYNNMLKKLEENKELNNFTDFIVEVTAKHVFKNPLPTLAEIKNNEYKDIIETALNSSLKKSFDTTLTDYLPDWFFNNSGESSGISANERESYLMNMNRFDSPSNRLMVFAEEELRGSFSRMTKSDKKKFFLYHTHVKLFWITKAEFEKEVEENEISKIPDCAIIDGVLGLQKEGKVLKMIMGDSIKPLIKIFKKLDNDVKHKIINTYQSPFKDKSFIIKKFENNYKHKDENTKTSINQSSNG